MNIDERPPPLEMLSVAQKDSLILELRDELSRLRAHCQVLEQKLAGLERQTAVGQGGTILAELQKPSADKLRPVPTQSRAAATLGRRLGFFRSDVVIGALIFVALAFAADRGIGWYQQSSLERKRLARLQLEHAANAGLLVELVKVAYEPDQKSYRLTMAMRNLDPEHPIFVMQSPIRVFQQSGIVWKEIPARVANGHVSGVLKLTDQYVYEAVFEPNLKVWTELIPGYMHIRFDNIRFISRRSEPDEDIVERNVRYYVYLKPHAANDEAIRRRMNYSGEPPVYIPMPPH